MSERLPRESPKSPSRSEPKSRDKEKYHLSPEFGSVLEKYPSHFLAKGGEHFVYEIGTDEEGDLRDVVVKANVLRAKQLDGLLKENRVSSFEDLPRETQEKVRQLVEDQDRKYRAMRKVFGSDHVVPQRMSIAEVPINPVIAEEVFGSGSEKSSAWTVVTLQKRAKELRDPNARIMDFGAEYLELKGVSPARYGEIADRHADKRLSALIQNAWNDPKLKEQVIDFIEKAVTYSEQEGEILDFIGSRNVYFYQQTRPDGEMAWSYRILDGFHAKPGRREIEVARAALARFEEQEEIRDQDMGTLVNALAYMRSMNAAAQALGIPRRIDLIGDFPKTKLAALNNAIRKKMRPVDPNATQT